MAVAQHTNAQKGFDLAEMARGAILPRRLRGIRVQAGKILHSTLFS